MVKEIIYSFEQYQKKYTELLEAFINDYEDNTELDFFKEQIVRYNIYLENVTFTEAVGIIDDDFTYS